MRHLPLVLVPCLASVAFAQEANLTLKPQEGPVSFEIQSTATVTTEREMLRDGEAMGGGRGGGRGGGQRGGGAAGPQESTTSQTVSFVQGDGWREYTKVEALVESTGRDGELVETEVAGALAGRKVSMQRDEEGQIVLVEGEGEDATELAANLGRGMSELKLEHLLPGKVVKVGDAYEIAHLGEALGSLMHPVATERAARGQRGQGGGRGGDQGGQGGGRGQRGGDQGGQGGGGQRGQRGQRGQGGRGQRGAGAANPLTGVLAIENLAWKSTGTLTSVENGVATITVAGTAAGEGTNEELGIQNAAGAFGRGRGGRGGNQGGGDAPAAETKNAIALEITGTITFDVAAGMITSVDMKSELKDERHMKMTMSRGDMDMEIESNSTTGGKIDVKVVCAPAK